MLKPFVLALVLAINFNLSASNLIAGSFRSCRFGDVDLKDVDAVLNNRRILRWFAATDRLLDACARLYPGRQLTFLCLCADERKLRHIRLTKSDIGKDYYLITPWMSCFQGPLSNFGELCKLVAANGVTFTSILKTNRRAEVSLEGLTVFAVDGEEVFTRKNLDASTRCTVFAAWQQYKSPEERAARARWSEAIVAWVGAAVRAGHARKPVTVVAKELEE